ncbi:MULTISPECIES: ABC transporter ATP-binding protein [unclassified Curtobacterium]|uniref:ABC transporter ATP-binding protein n=1 Tax=unclassified Curtobacterium TaxID=257496 RepID=UPI0008DDAE36|nr:MULTISPECIES: ABC transporter ATP-binding protein [unclassified Curtobacterium]OIH96360.1 multidrug ABC transporter ATP-binding protein [Curtobacterium sp. MCBA15_003]OII13652.1 multidrug ABC transporter ATP-binding protein [Curtobacterium sp. MCBA15_009]OII32698.1 multidrug ABC transporter ATP-binding protein [Curtobacterium sp. MMLR14_006]WIE66179.1 ABC transporter ATP-binding protein [Curtobacterium sp. MCLR17_036]
MIEVDHLTKQYGPKTAVDDVSFVVRPGSVTGFLGPNGAGKSTTMRMIMGLDEPTSGRAIVNGRPYRTFRDPLRQVGALLEAKAVHSGRSAYNHLLSLAATHGIPKSRVHEVIDMTGLDAVAKKRVGGFSLGMGQRLGIAAALLGDPKTLILDEPVNGLDPDGVVWVRQLARRMAADGRTVFLSSHLMSEMAQTADRVVVLGRGKVLADAPIAEFVAGANAASGVGADGTPNGGGSRVVVRTPSPDQLFHAIGPNASVTQREDGSFLVVGPDAPTVGTIAAQAGVVLHELTPTGASLEEAYMALTRDDVEYRSEGTR